ncbi:PREDICTED: A-kinase anchor protein 17B-like [Elephantulus edwardii]|uniref:A-kinase anchor protein 17B-like n=1 Tax=Elephantulus edwardii TaxID=28737 RepID=UPI0003F09A52|nr:PREDICTED: A-kinase anchor protein 17B-like [Elephantulus edwardii]
MTVTVVYDNSEATELCAAQHLYLKPIAKLMINVLLPESTEPVRPFSNWEVLDQLKSLICPDQFTTVRLSKSTKDFIRFEGEAETRSLVQILKAKLHGKIIKLNGLKTDLRVVATDAQGEWDHFPKAIETPLSDGAEEQDLEKSPDSIYFEGLPCKWFAPKGSTGEKPCEEILRVVFESFGKIKNVDIPMLDPYREVMTGGSFGSFSFGLQTFEAFIQYQESTDFVKAMESLRGMKLMLKGDDGKALACNIKVMFDTTKHFSEGAIRRRNQERLKLQELEEERKKEKRREEQQAERRRRDEERKTQEKRRKARFRRQVLKERDRHRRKKRRDKSRAKVSQDPDSSEEWEERKYLLAQRRVEALRLLRILLRNIAIWIRRESLELHLCSISCESSHKLLDKEILTSQSNCLILSDNEQQAPSRCAEHPRGNHSPGRLLLTILLLAEMSRGEEEVARRNSSWGSTRFNPQVVDPEPDEDPALEETLETLVREEVNTQYLQTPEKMPKYPIAKLDNKRKQKMKRRTRTHSRKSSRHLRKKKLRCSTRKERPAQLLTGRYNHSFISDQNLSQIPTIHAQSWEREDGNRPNRFYASREPEGDCSRRQKIYETDKFIDYLLNYYRTPPYARMLLKPGYIASPSQWQRAVYAQGDGVKIHLRRCGHHVTSWSPIPELERRERAQEDDCWPKPYTQDPDTFNPHGTENVDYAKDYSKGIQNYLKDMASEAGDPFSLVDGESHLRDEIHGQQVKDLKSRKRKRVSSPYRSAGLALELKDVLEEISSDSECFQEAHSSINKEDQEDSESVYHSSPEKEPFDPDDLIFWDAESRCGQQTLYSNCKQSSVKKHPQYKFRKPDKRTKRKLSYSWLESKDNSIRDDRSNSRKRGEPAHKYSFDDGYYHNPSSMEPFKTVTRKKQRFNGRAFNQKMNYRSSHVPMMSSQSAHTSYPREFSTRREAPWNSNYSQDKRRFKRREDSEDFMLNSDNYYHRHNNQEDTGYLERYRGNSYSSPLYFQMF